MEKIRVHLDTKSYDVKPKNEYGKITKRVVERVYDVTLEEFAHIVGEGKRAFTRALFKPKCGKRQADTFESQRLFVVDVDDSLSYEDFMVRCREYEIFPFLAYKTLRASDTQEKYRGIFLCDSIITDGRVARAMNEMLCKIFPESDSHCKDLARLFLGGKEVICFSPEKRVSIMDIVVAYQAYEKEKDLKNYRRNVVGLAKRCGIACEDGQLCIYDKEKTNRRPDREYIETDNIIFELCEVKTEYSEKKEKGDKESKRKKHDEKLPLLQIERSELLSSCQLLRTFEKEDIPHGLKFLLATSLVYIKSGKKLFFGCLQENKVKWEIQWKEIKEYEYYPTHCTSYECPYAEQCGAISLYEKVAKKIRKIKNYENYVSLETAQEHLKKYFKEILCMKDKGIYLIKAQTALGKTELYCNMAAQYPEIKFMFVVPTIKLQDQVVQSLRKRNVETYKTISSYTVIRELKLEIMEDVQNLYDAGEGSRVKAYIKKYADEHVDEMEPLEKKKLEESFEMIVNLDGSCCVVTTHMLFLHLPRSVLEKYEVVVDEDILMTIVKESRKVDIEDIKKACSSTILRDEIVERLDEIMDIQNKKAKRMEGGEKYPIDPRLKDYGKIYGLLNSSVCYMDKETKAVYYFKAKSLPDVKMVILSATLNEKLYRDYCTGRKIQLMEVPTVKYKGNLIQCTYYSMSRRCINEKGWNTILQRIKEYTGLGDEYLISFKCFDESRGIYYGKSEGFNDYSGKNLVVLGTPHYAECVYVMLGKYMGYDISGSLAKCRINKNGYSFTITTYKNTHMQNLQLFFIESELEQAVGRARLLRNDCTVYLFSDFPVRQAQICQEDYLKVGEKS